MTSFSFSRGETGPKEMASVTCSLAGAGWSLPCCGDSAPNAGRPTLLASQFDFAPTGAGQIEVGPHERRTSQCVQNSAGFERRAREQIAHRHMKCIGWVERSETHRLMASLPLCLPYSESDMGHA